MPKLLGDIEANDDEQALRIAAEHWPGLRLEFYAHRGSSHSTWPTTHRNRSRRIAIGRSVERKMVLHDTDLKELPMFRRSAVTAFALVVAFALGVMLSNRPATVSAQPAAGRGKCIAMSVVHWGPGVPGDYRAFRAFEDGTVEMTEQQGPDNSTVWVKIGK